MTEQNKNDLPANYMPKDAPVAPVSVDPELTAEEEEILKRKIEELRKRDPFVYR